MMPRSLAIALSKKLEWWIFSVWRKDTSQLLRSELGLLPLGEERKARLFSLGQSPMWEEAERGGKERLETKASYEEAEKSLS